MPVTVMVVAVPSNLSYTVSNKRVSFDGLAMPRLKAVPPLPPPRLTDTPVTCAPLLSTRFVIEPLPPVTLRLFQFAKRAPLTPARSPDDMPVLALPLTLKLSATGTGAFGFVRFSTMLLPTTCRLLLV